MTGAAEVSLAEGWPRALAALLLVLGAALLLAWTLRRAGLARPLSPAARLDVVASRPLDGRSRLVVARWDDREHLVAVGPAGVTVIESRTAAAMPAAAPGPGSGP